MDLTGVHGFLSALDGRLRDIGLDTTYVEGERGVQIGDTLRTLMAVTDEAHPVITEFVVTGFAEDADLLHIYTTVLLHVERSKEALASHLLECNLLCPLGHFGIYEEEGQLYHKYSYPFDRDTAPEDLALTAENLLGLIYEVISGNYPSLEPFADAPEADEKGGTQ